MHWLKVIVEMLGPRKYSYFFRKILRIRRDFYQAHIEIMGTAKVRTEDTNFIVHILYSRHSISL